MEDVKKLNLQKISRLIVVMIAGTLLITISAKTKIPFYPVPMTMQTFAILLIGITFGFKIGTATVALYLLEGIFGLPVFAGTPEKGLGLTYFAGPTMGYLIGFLFSVYLAGYIKFSKNIFFNFLKLSFAVSFIYILGYAWLGYLIGWDKPIFKIGVQPFLLAELFKIMLLAFLVPSLIKVKKNLKLSRRSFRKNSLQSSSMHF